MNANSQLSTQISEALARGDAMAALRLMRQAGTHGLKDALAAAQSQAAQARQAGSATGNDVRAALQSGDPIEAMRRLRSANPGMSLRDAKQAVEAMQHGVADVRADTAAKALTLRARAERPPTVQEGDHGGYGMVLLAVVSAVAALAWWWLGGA